MRIIFMGSPAFAVPALLKLVEAGHEIAAVYTKAPKPAGRGQKESKSAIHQKALELGIENIITPKTLRSLEALEEFNSFNADVAVVAAYGLILPAEVLSSPKYGCLNIHPSLLPRWRGAAPIQRTILSGDSKTAVCIMQMDEGLDTGDILSIMHYDIPASYTAGDLHDLMAKEGANLLIETISDLPSITKTPQSTEGITYADKINKQEALISWQDSAWLNHRKIRGFSPYPGAYFVYKNERIKVLAADYEEEIHNHQPGTILNSELHIACATGIIKPTLLQREGKKPLPLTDFLRGFGFEVGMIISN
jgi:methionyl-tRNA formyltransferase